MKKFLLVAMVAVGLGSVAACNRDATPGSPNRTNPGRPLGSAESAEPEPVERGGRIRRA